MEVSFTTSAAQYTPVKQKLKQVDPEKEPKVIAEAIADHKALAAQIRFN